MSAAIKRLSTIIRPSNTSPPPPPKESGKISIDAPAPAAPVDTTTAEPSPKAEENLTDATTDVVSDAVDSAAPEQGPTATPAPDAAPTEDVKDAPSTTDAPKDKNTTAPAVVASKEKEGKATHRRDPRDIGRSTIRRFSTILRSQAKDTQKDKELVPPLPSQDDAAKAGEGETKAPEEQAPAAEEATNDAVVKVNGATDSATTEKDAKPNDKPTPETKGKTDQGKVSKRRSSSFFTAAREGLQRTAKDVQTRARGQPRAAKTKAIAKVEVVPKIVKKGAAKGKRVVVITGASKGVGFELVKQFASKPNMFVIALSRTAEKSGALKPIVTASAKEGHNVRSIKLDLSSSRSIQNVVKDIVELTEGRIDLLINAAGTRGDPALKIWDLQGGELEDELRNNLIGPVTFTNALIPYLKPMPSKEEKKDEGEKDEKPEAKEEEAEGKAEAKQEIKEKSDEKEKEVEENEEQRAEMVATEVKPDTQDTAATSEPSVQTPDATAETPVKKPTEAVPAAGEPAEVTAEEAPVLPLQPFVVFLAPSDPIQNIEGAVSTGSSFAPSPRTLFSLSRAALQVAIAKYAIGLASNGIGIVGVERHGLHDPHSAVSDAQSVEGVIKALPGLSIRDNGKLLKTGM